MNLEEKKAWILAVEDATKKLDVVSWPKENNSRFYNLELNGNNYPPKVVFAEAAEILLSNNPDFKIPLVGGGIPTNNFLSKLGFTIVKEQQVDYRKLDLDNSRFYKLSMGTLRKNNPYSNTSIVDDLEKNNLVLVHKNTGKNQAELFAKGLEVGDYIYITYGNRLGQIAKIKSGVIALPDDFANSELLLDWYVRRVEYVFKPRVQKTDTLSHLREFWLPSGNSTLFEIPNILRANDILFKPFYNVEFYDSKKVTDVDLMNTEIFQKKNEVIALNQILYGPPGTGKTFKLKEEYFDKFTISESSLSKDQFILNVVTDLTWWQTFAIALYDVGTITVNQLLDNEIVKAKASLSNAKNIKPIAWSRMQAHALPDCPNVNVSDSNEPSLFYKEADSQWRIVKENVEALYPEGIELLNEIKNFQPNKDKSIKNYEFVTFHQSFSYEDFIEGIKPKLEEGASNLEYEINDGVFKKLCQRAQKDLDNNYCIFIDEINRGNVSSIFGELITLIEDDKRIGRPQELKVKLPYSKTEFGVPPNLYIIGTMNTADRSVEALDTALRRRFVFKEVMPDPSLLLTKTFNGFNLEQVLTAINERIEVLLDRDHTIGHSYFIKLESGNTEGLSSIFKNNIIPLLQEYFYNDYEKIALVLGLGFLREKVAKKNIFPKLKNIEEPENNNVYELVDSINNIEEAVTLLLDNSNE
ncbi:MAG: AAA family ATPase [Maribacter dokdonensis]|uniref:McrB family protein n=5 Tax=Maribacter dokdonensis TaxID=320912 RepID=UPI0032667E8F